MHVLQVIWSRYKSTDVSAVNPMRFTVFVFHLNHQTVRFGDLKVKSKAVDTSGLLRIAVGGVAPCHRLVSGL